jgi:hypothetical protein
VCSFEANYYQSILIKSLTINFGLHFVESGKKIGFERLNQVVALKTIKAPIYQLKQRLLKKD